MKLKLKVIYNGDIRIFKIDDTNINGILPALRTFIDKQFGVENFILTYIDEENDKITISRQDDLKLAIDHYKELRKIPKIFISIKQQILSTPQPRVQLPQQIYSKQHQYYQDNPNNVNTNANNNIHKWIVEPSIRSLSTRNKIFEVTHQLDMNILPQNKKFISLAMGDPTKYPNLLPSNTVTNAVQSKLLSQQHNGYVMSYGLQEARVAISKKYTLPHINLSEEDIIVTIGASDALNMALCSLLNEGDNFLSPRPGYSFYDTIASRYNFKCKKYNLIPDNEWQIDINHMKSLIDKRTKAIVITNPSNPCGSVLKQDILKKVIKIAEDYSIPIIADEVYAEMVYDNDNGDNKFYSVASLSQKVPVLTMGGLSKQYLVPGWRVGWIVIHDPIKAFIKVRTALQKLSTVLLGPNTLIQASIPSILFETPDSYYNDLNNKLHRQSTILYNHLNEISALTPIKARGAIYLMVKIEISKLKNIKNGIDFAAKLLREQGILVLPGAIFSYPNYFRAVVCPPPHIMHEVGKRMKEFCAKYSKSNATMASKL